MNDPTTAMMNELDLKLDIGADDILYLTVSGKVSNAKIGEFMDWAEQVKYAISKIAGRKNGSVKVLTDADHVRYFETRAVAVVRELLDYDSRYPIKSAIICSNQMTGMALDAVIAISMRKNVRRFTSKKEALEWLLSYDPVIDAKKAEKQDVA
jgi:hypothetical protein